MDTHTVAYPDSGAPAMDEEEECADTNLNTDVPQKRYHAEWEKPVTKAKC